MSTEVKSKQAKPRKKTIPKPLKEKVWRKLHGDKIDAPCYTCDKLISILDHEAGHIIAEANGGSATEDNLRPVCRTCNRSMGTRNMEDFKAEYFIKGQTAKPKKTRVTKSKKVVEVQSVSVVDQVVNQVVDPLADEIKKMQLDKLKKEKDLADKIEFIMANMTCISLSPHKEVAERIAIDQKQYNQFMEIYNQKKKVFVNCELFTGKPMLR